MLEKSFANKKKRLKKKVLGRCNILLLLLKKLQIKKIIEKSERTLLKKVALIDLDE